MGVRRISYPPSDFFLPSTAFFAAFAILGLVSNSILLLCHGVHGTTSTFVRKNEKTQDMPLNSDVFKEPSGYNAPQQVHITQGDHEGRAVIVSWVTMKEPGSGRLQYRSVDGNSTKNVKSTFETYKYYNYTSGYIHHCTIKNLKHDSNYRYKIGTKNSSRSFLFKTPPKPGPDVPYTFGIIGDLGQTFDSNKTVAHYEMNPMCGEAVLYVGDLSYADNYPFNDNRRWDSWGRFVERSAAVQPWIWTAGNHELDFRPEFGEKIPFKPFLHRYHVPYKSSGSTESLWYSIKRASAYIIVLSSYSAFGKYTPQSKWLEQEFEKVNRSETPWLIILMHSPFYNSYNSHYMEGETMRVMYEPWFVQFKVDLVFAGHVHAYERSKPVSNIKYNIVNGACKPAVNDESGPVYLTVGDGGNIEGLSVNMTEPQPEYSAFREASFGHAMLEIKNSTHAHFSWFRNDDGYSVQADSAWFVNRYSKPRYGY